MRGEKGGGGLRGCHVVHATELGKGRNQKKNQEMD